MPQRKRKPVTAWMAGGQSPKIAPTPKQIEMAKKYLKAIAERDGAKDKLEP